MNVHLCTISFRHELVSFSELMDFAERTGFSGIELWSVHAASVAGRAPLQGARAVRELRRRGLEVAMISGYVQLLANTAEEEAEANRHWARLISLARLFETRKLRIFAGHLPSREAEEADWALAFRRLRELADAAAEHGIRTVVETHPGTLVDNLASALRLVREIRHPAVKLNLDFLHLWEAGDAPAEAFRQLLPWIGHCHCKNITSRRELNVFEPGNVYAPGGSREGMTPLAAGAVDYAEIMGLLKVCDQALPLSLEWFGAEPYRHLSAEMDWVRRQFGGLDGKRALVRPS